LFVVNSVVLRGGGVVWRWWSCVSLKHFRRYYCFGCCCRSVYQQTPSPHRRLHCLARHHVYNETGLAPPAAQSPLALAPTWSVAAPMPT
jgi:hypothetical protein